jgi:DNA-binding transcriptional LysR family regulator
MTIAPLHAADLELLAELFRRRSLGRAAQALSVEQSTLSRRLDALEARLDVRLFSRTKRGLVPTRAAAALARHGEVVERAVQDARAVALREATEARGAVRLSAPEVLADMLLAPALPALFERAPGLELELTSTGDVADLDRLEADVALRFVRPTAPSVVVKTLGSTPIGVFVSTADRVRRAREPGELSWITWGGDHRDRPDARLLEARGARIALRSNRMPTMLAAARAGVGALLLPRAFAERVQGLREVEVSGLPPMELSVYLASPEAVRRLPGVAEVWRFVVETFERAWRADPAGARGAAGSKSS